MFKKRFLIFLSIFILFTMPESNAATCTGTPTLGCSQWSESSVQCNAHSALEMGGCSYDNILYDCVGIPACTQLSIDYCADFGCTPMYTCGDLVCDPTEDCSSCSVDCDACEMTCYLADGVACNAGDVTMFRMSATDNAQAGLEGYSDYDIRVCCGGISGLGASDAVVDPNVGFMPQELFRLSDTDNAHVTRSLNPWVPYDDSIGLATPGNCYIELDALIDGCPSPYTAVASVSDEENAMLYDPSAMPDKVCCVACSLGWYWDPAYGANGGCVQAQEACDALPDSCYGETGDVDICYEGSTQEACCTGCFNPNTGEYDVYDYSCWDEVTVY